jgi:[ribosomal protein S18]-alanine N-acetyltransferase
VPILHLHPLTSDLLPAILDLDRLCFGGLWTLEGYQRELESPNSDLWVLSIASASQAESVAIGIGCLWAIVDEAHITIVGIHPAYQRQGLGQVMLWTLLKSAQQRGLERATLEVRASNRAALSLYEKFGFREAGRRRRYYADDEDALILWRGGLQFPQFPDLLASWRAEFEGKVRQIGWETQF